MPEKPGMPTSKRQARTQRNDERIVDACVALLDRAGWEQTTLAGIAHEVGLTHPTVMGRYASRDMAVVDAWERRLAAGFRAALQECVRVVDGPDVSADRLLHVLEPFIAPDTSMRAVAEVLIVSRFTPALQQAVAETVGADLDAALTPVRGQLTRTQAARRAFVLSLALGSLIEVRRHPPGEVLDLSLESVVLARALSAQVSPTRLPARRAEHLGEPPTFDIDDPALVSLLAATLDEVGGVGYEKATLKRIAASAGFTTGLIFARYEDKLALFLDATDRMLTRAEAINHDFMVQVAAATSAGVAEATLTREMMRPDLTHVRLITYEQYRMSWHEARMQETFATVQAEIAARGAALFPDLTPEQVRAKAFVSLARGIGLGLLADLHPPAWQLPHDVVTVPLTDLLS